jgi:DNA polymerase phi
MVTQSNDEQNSQAAAATSGSLRRLAFRELASIACGTSNTEYPTLDETTKDVCRRQMSAAAASLVRHPEDFATLCDVIAGIDTMSIEMSEDIRSSVNSAIKRLRKLVDKKGQPILSQADYGLAVFHAVAILQLFNDPGPDAMEILEDTKNCYDKILQKKKSGEAGMADILVESILSMLAASSKLTREASVRVFEAFTYQVSSVGLENFFEILATPENSKGFEQLFSKAEDEELDSDGDDEMEDVDGLILANANGAIDEDASQGDGNDESESESDHSSLDAHRADGSGESQSFEKALMSAFKVSHTLDKDKEADSSDEDVDMSDSEMLKIDEKVVSHLKLLKGKGGKKQAEESRRKVIEFKHRVLDLLAVFAKKEATRANILVFSLLPQLLRFVKQTKDQALVKKATGIISETQALTKKARTAMKHFEVSKDDLVTILKGIHEAADDPGESKTFASALSSASSTVASALMVCKGGRKNFDDIAAVYHDTQRRWVGGAHIRSSFFESWVAWCQSVRQRAEEQPNGT